MPCSEQKSWKAAKSKDEGGCEGVGECGNEGVDADSDEGCDKIAWLILGCLGGLVFLMDGQRNRHYDSP